jgi:hypothetical protein
LLREKSQLNFKLLLLYAPADLIHVLQLLYRGLPYLLYHVCDVVLKGGILLFLPCIAQSLLGT